LNRRPAQRSTTYEILSLFDGQEEPLDILDSVEVKGESFEFRERSPSQKAPRPGLSSSNERKVQSA